MKKLICLMLLIVCFTLFAKTKEGPSIKVYGVPSKVGLNVEKRLHELQLLKPLAEFNEEELSTQVIKAIQPFAYFKAKVSIEKPDSEKLIIIIQSGPQILISSLKIEIIGEGAENISLRHILKHAPLKSGSPLLTKKYEQLKLKLIDTAENLGYLHAYFKKNEILIDEEQYKAEISLIFDTGPLYYFGQIDFDPSYINPKLLQRFLPFQPGQIYSSNQILKLNNDLANSGYFSSVQIKPHIDDATANVPIRVHTQAVAKYSYTLGAGYGTDTGVRGRAALHVIPVNHRGHKFNTLAQSSFIQNALQAQYLIPGVNPVNDQYSLTSNYSNLNYNLGDSNSLLLSLTQEHHVKNYQRTLSVNSLYESFHYTFQEDAKQFLLYPKASYSFSKTEGLLFSASGYNFTINGFAATKKTLSAINLAQISVDFKGALRINPWRLRLYGHAIQGFTAVNNINQQPLSLALLLGGADNLKAYGFNSIGPGKIISYAGFEIQKETKKNWYLTAFCDVGDVYSPNPKNLHYDAGGGLMWVSPIGPIKLGLAQAIDSQWQRHGNKPRLVISMGPDL